MTDTDDTDQEYDCEQHEINLDDLPAGYNHCPRCRQIERAEAEYRHKVTRDRTLEPW